MTAITVAAGRSAPHWSYTDGWGWIPARRPRATGRLPRRRRAPDHPRAARPPILVLDGTSAALGTHEQLLATSPLYRDLVGTGRPDSGNQPHSSAMRTASNRFRAPVLRIIVDT